MIELVRRAHWVLWMLAVVVGCLFGALAPVERPRSPARARAIEWRAIRPLAGRLVAVRVQLIIA